MKTLFNFANQNGFVFPLLKSEQLPAPGLSLLTHNPWERVGGPAPRHPVPGGLACSPRAPPHTRTGLRGSDLRGDARQLFLQVPGILLWESCVSLFTVKGNELVAAFAGHLLVNLTSTLELVCGWGLGLPRRQALVTPAAVFLLSYRSPRWSSV